MMRKSIIFLVALNIGMIHGEGRKHKKVSGDVYNAQTGIYAAKEGASVGNITKKPTGELAGTIGRSKHMGQEARENTVPFSRVSNSSNASRYKEIKVSAEIAADEIDFWGRQMSEHALFLYLGFEDADFKEEALMHHKKLEEFRTAFNKRPRDMEHMNSLLPMLQKEREFQIRALKALEEGKWIGWIFPLFINHTTLELDYLIDKLNGIKYSSHDEVLFWNRINSEHAAFAAHLLDPAERDLFLKADELSTKFDKIPKSEKEMMIGLSLKASEELDAFNKTTRKAGKKVKHVIHPVLLDHVIREGERSIKTLKSLNLNTEAAALEQQYQEQINQYQA